MCGVIQRGRQVGLAAESGAVLAVSRDICREHLQRIVTREARMLDQIDLTHATEPRRRTILNPAKLSPSFNDMSECLISQSDSHCGMPTSRRNCVEGERRGKPRQGRVGDRSGAGC